MTDSGITTTVTFQNAARKQLLQFIEGIERLQEEQKALGADIKDKFLEAKGVGFDVKTMRKIIARRRKSTSELQEEDAMLETYLAALDMQGDMFAEPEPANDRADSELEAAE